MERLDSLKVDQMFAVWERRPSDRFVAKVFGVSKSTVRKYRLREGWEQRRRNIIMRARELVAMDPYDPFAELHS